MKAIIEIIKKFGLKGFDVISYGKYMAKLNVAKLPKKNGKLILVTAINPTKSGDGKTTISINLNDCLNHLNEKAIVALRQPSLGPCFGLKGGATGSGLACLEPQEKINLHFTGDFHAITTANNLISAILDNEIYQGNKLNIDPTKIVHSRAIDMNDRSLRNLLIKVDKKIHYHTNFIITAACEIMTIFCLAKNRCDFKKKLDGMIVAYKKNNQPIYVKDLQITKAIMAIMNDCFYPNVVQTKQENLALVSGGPFANVSLGINSYLATSLGMKLADWLITEAGFGADLGAEKFLNILCQQTKLKPACIVLIVTVKAILAQGGGCLEKGINNLNTHLNHLKSYGSPIVVAINHFSNDKKQDLNFLTNFLVNKKIIFSINDGFLKGINGGLDLAKKIIKIAKVPQKINFLYSPKEPLKIKIEKIVKKCYRINTIIYSSKAEQIIKKYANNNYYVCFSKQPNHLYSLLLNGLPIIKIENVFFNHGAKLVIVVCNNIFLLPGLPLVPKAKLWK